MFSMDLETDLGAGALYISRHNGDAVQEDEVRQLLNPFGAIEKVWLPSETDREMYQLPKGIWVRFAYFQDCRDAHAVRLL